MIEVFTQIRLLIAVLTSCLLAFHGYKKKSLDFSGSVAAILVGFISFASSYRFGIILIVFYYTSSKLTKIKEDYKATLEQDYAVGGQRNFIQVFANSLLATLICIFNYWLFGEDTFVSYGVSKDTVSYLGLNFILPDYKSTLLCMYVAHYACACGDTWASEVGVLSKTEPRLVTTLFLRKVPKGTNGGMSLLGTVASGLGGSLIGFIFWLMSLFQFVDETTRMYESHLAYKQYPMIVIGLIAGLLGSLYDSLLGATLQSTYYSKDKKCIVKGVSSISHSKNGIIDNDSSIQHISGVNILTNEAVNFVSIFLTMISMAILSPYIFCLLDSNQCHSF